MAKLFITDKQYNRNVQSILSITMRDFSSKDDAIRLSLSLSDSYAYKYDRVVVYYFELSCLNNSGFGLQCVAFVRVLIMYV